MNNNSTNSTHQTGSTHPPQPNTPADPRAGSDNLALDSPLRGEVEESGRERLKRLRVEVAGRVWIPDIWGQEELLKDWIDCNAFDASLVNNNIISARAALVQEDASWPVLSPISPISR
ncbi:hypothetical protein LguiA_032368 [Lonicera macranthoides]